MLTKISISVGNVGILTYLVGGHVDIKLDHEVQHLHLRFGINDIENVNVTWPILNLDELISHAL